MKKGLVDKLVHVSDADAGIYRKRRGRGFVYLNADGNKITKSNIAKRIAEIKIPPMWEDVWICQLANGHIQATGKDAKGRKQYIYHEAWSDYRNTTKFQRMAGFARALPQIRTKLRENLKLRQWNKEKVLALVVQLLDEAFIRVGNIYYKEQNNTYGLTTLRRKHLMVEKKRLFLQYKAKSGKTRKVNIINKQLVKLIKECSELPGHELFRYVDEHGKYQPVNSHDVNEYIHTLSGQDFSSKDFRTWGGTVLAIAMLEKARDKVKENPRLGLIPTLVGEVATTLGNTNAICREYYIHPAVLNAIETDALSDYSKNLRKKYRKISDLLETSELIALNIIEANH